MFYQIINHDRKGDVTLLLQQSRLSLFELNRSTEKEFIREITVVPELDKADPASGNVIGYLLVKSINETFVPFERLFELWTEAGLPPRYARRRPRRPAAAFVSAVRRIQSRVSDFPDGVTTGEVELHGQFRCTCGRSAHLDGTYPARVLVRNSRTRRLYHVVRESVVTIDDTETLLHHTFGTLRWDDEAEAPVFEWDIRYPGEEELSRALAERVSTLHELLKTSADSMDIRNIIERMLAEENIFRMSVVKSTHFVPASKSWISEGLEDFFEFLRPYAANSKYPAACWAIPALRTKSIKDLVAHSLLAHQSELLEEARQQIRLLAKEGATDSVKLAERVKKHVRKIRNQIAQLLEEYRVLLEMKFDSVERNVVFLDTVLGELEAGKVPEV